MCGLSLNLTPATALFKKLKTFFHVSFARLIWKIFLTLCKINFKIIKSFIMHCLWTHFEFVHACTVFKTHLIAYFRTYIKKNIHTLSSLFISFSLKIYFLILSIILSDHGSTLCSRNGRIPKLFRLFKWKPR